MIQNRNKDRIVIYRDLLLPPSETFIKNQSGKMKIFDPCFIGSRREPGIELPREKVYLLNNGTLPGRFREAMYKLFAYAPAMVKRIRQLQPRLVHAHMGKDATLYLPLHKHFKIPFLVTFHGTDATTSDEWKRSRNRITYKLYLQRREQLIKEADLFIAVSGAVKNGLLNQGYPEEKILIHYIGIDLDFFSPDLQAQREPVVLFVSRLEEFKGCQHVIEALAPVQKERRDIKLVVIGDGPYRRNLENLAKEKLSNYTFLGTQSHETVREWMNRSWVLSVPSEREGMPTYVQEAMAMGLPMALFDIPASREAVGEELCDCLVENKSITGLAGLIKSLFDNKDLWQRLSDSGIKRAHDVFNIEKQTAELEENYLKLIKGYTSD